MTAPAHLPLSALPEQTDTSSSCAAELPLTSEPPLPDAAPLTSEPPLTDAAPLTSEPTSTVTAAGLDPMAV